jgi:hypothetical protein
MYRPSLTQGPEVQGPAIATDGIRTPSARRFEAHTHTYDAAEASDTPWVVLPQVLATPVDDCTTSVDDRMTSVNDRMTSVNDLVTSAGTQASGVTTVPGMC